ncbi:unnamed protein product [Cylindrotheca closterium]|uniref:Myb-like domain-containing protein n=1 Tax=Cylindrotheca closterium TaxID=2856 RepID=A0AAD2GBK2_9STRA|nr:unnamed protein product [Cylindrotheca closterium]
MKLERVLFPEDVLSSRMRGKKASNCLGDISNRGGGGKTKATRGKRQQQKHRVGKKAEFVSVLMNLDGNKPAKREKKNSRSSKQHSVPKEQADSLSHKIGATQSSRPLNDSNPSIQIIDESLMQSLGATESLLLLGSLNGNARSKNAQSKSGRKSEPRRNKRGRVSKRAREFVTKLIQGTGSDGIVRDKRSSGVQSKMSETSEKANARNILMESRSSGKPSQQQQKTRRPKRHRDSIDDTSKLQDTQELQVTELVKPASKKIRNNISVGISKLVRGKRAKFTESNERSNRRKDKLEVSCGGLGALCGLNNNGRSFPVPNPVLNRSVLVSPLTVESLDCNGYKDGGKCSKKSKRFSSKRNNGSNAKTKDHNVHGKKKATKAHQRLNMHEGKKTKVLSPKRDKNTESTKMAPKQSLDLLDPEQESVCASFSVQSPVVVTQECEASKKVSLSLSTKGGDILLNKSVSGSIRNIRKESKSLGKGSLSTKCRIAKSRRLISMSHTWDQGSSRATSIKRDALNQEAGKYVIEVEEADLSLLHQRVADSFEQRHQVAERPNVSLDSNCDCQESKQTGESSDRSDGKERAKKSVPARKLTGEIVCEQMQDPKGRRGFGLSIDVNVKPSPRLGQGRKPFNQTEKEKKTAGPTPLRKSPRLRTPDNSDDDKENNETKSTRVRRSRRSVGRPRRLGVFEGEDDSIYVPTPSATSASKKKRNSKTSAERLKPKPKPIEQEQGKENPEIKTIQWREDEILLLKEAQKEVDPKSYSYWQDVADLVGTRSAEDCQEKWFSLAKTPNVRQRKKKGKANLKEIPNSPQDDDIFDATPMKALFSKSSIEGDPLLGSIGFLSQLNLGSAVKVERVPIDHESKTLATKRGYKSYIKDMRREVLAKDKKKPPRLPKEKSSKARNVREKAGEGDIELRGRLSPGGTIHMTSNVDEEIDDEYNMDEECDDDDPFFSRRVQA